MATLTVQAVSMAGLSPNYATASAGGDKVAPGERTFLHIKNGSASPTTVTVTSTASFRGGSVADLTVSVPASGERMVGPITPDRFAGDSDGLASIGWSSPTSMTVAALRI